MEGVGLAASLATLAEVIKLAVDLQRRFEDAPTQIERTINRVCFYAVGMQLLLESEGAQPGNVNTVMRYDALIAQCHRAMEAITYDLDMLLKPSHTRRIRWALLGYARARDLTNELSQLETTIIFITTLLQRQNVINISDTTTLISQNLSILTKDIKDQQCICKNLRRDVCNPHRDCERVEDSSSMSQTGTSFHRHKLHVFRLAELTWSLACLQNGRKCRSLSSLHFKFLGKLGVKVDLGMFPQTYGGLPYARFDPILISITHCVPLGSPFMAACKTGNLEKVRELLKEEPASVRYSSMDGETPLSLAIQEGHLEVCRTLLDSGTKVNSPFGRYQTSALSWALKHRQPDIARLLVSRNASFQHLSAWGWSPIFYLWSQTRRHAESATFLYLLRSLSGFNWLHEGVFDVHGFSLLARCALYGTPEDVLLLIKYGCDPFEQEPEYHWTILHRVVYFGVEDVFFALFPMFLETFGVEMPDVRGWTLLHLAIESGSSAIVRHLIESGANWKAETLPSLESVPETLQGVPISPAQLAVAHGEKRYLEFLDILEDVVVEPQGQEVWYDAMSVMEGG